MALNCLLQVSTCFVCLDLATGTYGLEIGAMVAQDMPVIYSKKHFAQVAGMTYDLFHRL